MSALIGPLVYPLLALSIGACIRLYPLRGALRTHPYKVVLIYALFYLAECAVYFAFTERFSANNGMQTFVLYFSLAHMFIPLLLVKSGVFVHLFLYLFIFNYSLVVFGAGTYVEAAIGGAFAARYPYLISDGVVVAISIPLLPLTLKGLDRIVRLLPDGRALVWKYIWVLPAAFIALCLMSANVFMEESMVVSAIFVIARLAAGIGVAATCLLLARSLRQEADNARHAENARMMERQLVLQREQYTRFAKKEEADKRARHDARHHLAVMMDYNQAGEREKLGAYLSELAGAVPLRNEEIYCDNFAVNAVAAHYLGQAKSEGIAIDAKLVIPEATGSVPAMDLCVVIGNLFENALDACRREKGGSAFIRVRSRVDGDALSIVVENSFDGQWRESNGSYLSQKYGSDVPREGVGLSSVHAVCEKHGGLMRIDNTGNVWKASALVEMHSVGTAQNEYSDKLCE